MDHDLVREGCDVTRVVLSNAPVFFINLRGFIIDLKPLLLERLDLIDASQLLFM